MLGLGFVVRYAHIDWAVTRGCGFIMCPYLADGVGEGGEEAEDDLVHDAREDEELGELRLAVGEDLIGEDDAVDDVCVGGRTWGWAVIAVDRSRRLTRCTFVHVYIYTHMDIQAHTPRVAVQDGDAGDGVDGPVHQGVDRLAVPGLLSIVLSFWGWGKRRRPAFEFHWNTQGRFRHTPTAKAHSRRSPMRRTLSSGPTPFLSLAPSSEAKEEAVTSRRC